MQKPKQNYQACFYFRDMGFVCWYSAQVFDSLWDTTTDKQLLAFHGCCPFRQYMPSKPARYGIKFQLCCDPTTSYVLNADIYTGREGNAIARRNLARNVVKLTRGLDRTGRNIIIDHFCTNVGLAAQKSYFGCHNKEQTWNFCSAPSQPAKTRPL